VGDRVWCARSAPAMARRRNAPPGDGVTRVLSPHREVRSCESPSLGDAGVGVRSYIVTDRRGTRAGKKKMMGSSRRGARAAEHGAVRVGGGWKPCDRKERAFVDALSQLSTARGGGGGGGSGGGAGAGGGAGGSGVGGDSGGVGDGGVARTLSQSRERSVLKRAFFSASRGSRTLDSAGLSRFLTKATGLRLRPDSAEVIDVLGQCVAEGGGGALRLGQLLGFDDRLARQPLGGAGARAAHVGRLAAHLAMDRLERSWRQSAPDPYWLWHCRCGSLDGGLEATVEPTEHGDIGVDLITVYEAGQGLRLDTLRCAMGGWARFGRTEDGWVALESADGVPLVEQLSAVGMRPLSRFFRLWQRQWQREIGHASAAASGAPPVATAGARSEGAHEDALARYFSASAGATQEAVESAEHLLARSFGLWSRESALAPPTRCCVHGPRRCVDGPVQMPPLTNPTVSLRSFLLWFARSLAGHYSVTRATQQAWGAFSMEAPQLPPPPEEMPVNANAWRTQRKRSRPSWLKTWATVEARLADVPNVIVPPPVVTVAVETGEATGDVGAAGDDVLMLSQSTLDALAGVRALPRVVDDPAAVESVAGPVAGPVAGSAAAEPAPSIQQRLSLAPADDESNPSASSLLLLPSAVQHPAAPPRTPLQPDDARLEDLLELGQCLGSANSSLKVLLRTLDSARPGARAVQAPEPEPEPEPGARAGAGAGAPTSASEENIGPPRPGPPLSAAAATDLLPPSAQPGARTYGDGGGSGDSDDGGGSVEDRELDVRRDFLSAVPACSQHEEALAGYVETVHIAAGDAIVTEGQLIDGIYFIMAGRADCSWGPSATFLETLRSGDFFGDVAVLTRQPAKATIRAAGEGGARCFKLGRRAFDSVVGLEIAEGGQSGQSGAAGQPSVFERWDEVSARAEEVVAAAESQLAATEEHIGPPS
jgi:hypothetical protein